MNKQQKTRALNQRRGRASIHARVLWSRGGWYIWLGVSGADQDNEGSMTQICRSTSQREAQKLTNKYASWV